MGESQLDLFGDVPFSILLKSVATSTREYDAIVLVVAGMRFSCDLQAGEGGARQLRIMQKLASRAGISIEAHGALHGRLASLAAQGAA